MQWLRVESKLVDHPKTMAAIELLGRGSGARLLGLWLTAACYAAHHDTDGFVPSAVVHNSDLDGKHKQIVEALLAVGLFEPHASGRGYQLHDFTHYNLSKQDQDQWRARKAEAGRKGGKHSVESRSKRQARALTTNEANAKQVLQEQVKHNEAPSPSPSPSPSPLPDPDPRRAVAFAPALERARALNAPLGAGTPTSLINGQSLRSHGSHAVCFASRGLCVPLTLHEELLGRLGGGDDPNARLLAFYAAEIVALGDIPVGDNAWDFWRNRFAAWVGTVTSKPKAGRSAQTIAAVRDALTAEIGKAGA